jgi:hypothetical protein
MHRTCIAISRYASVVSIHLMKKWRVMFVGMMFLQFNISFGMIEWSVLASRYLVATNCVKTTEEKHSVV